jgi:predicted dithiol-disulfide oxidoreductase (DUF899 family)
LRQAELALMRQREEVAAMRRAVPLAVPMQALSSDTK